MARSFLNPNKDCETTNSKSVSSPVNGAGPAGKVNELVTHPSVTATCLAGFCLVSAGVFLPALETDPSSGERDGFLARSALQLFSGKTGAAQAAADAAAQDPSYLMQGQAAAHPAAEELPTVLSAVPSSPILDLDQAAHNLVTAHTSYSWRALVADIYISDIFITLGISGWLLCTALCVAANPKKAAGPLALAWSFYFSTCGAFWQGDPPLVDVLKNAFGRVRPSTLHHTFSFPSGHTSAAVFIAGGLVAVLLPLTAQLLNEKQQAAPDSNQGSRQSSSSTAVSSGDSSASSWGSSDIAALVFWGAAWVTTAAGRVLADAHWVSDTLAGGLLAVAVVSALAQCMRVFGSGSASSMGDEAASNDGF